MKQKMPWINVATCLLIDSLYGVRCPIRLEHYQLPQRRQKTGLRFLPVYLESRGTSSLPRFL